jgi:dolichol-phosphate mannosyltransferase
LKHLVIIPTYNEVENIEPILSKVFQLPEPFHVLVVDDSSPDGTGKVVKSLKENFAQSLFLIERQGKTGLGTAYIAGFEWALQNNYQVIYEMDADFSHNPKDLPRLKAEIEKGADVAVGSRYTSNGRVKDWPISRILLSYFASVYVRLILGIKVKDTTAGFVAYKKEVLEKTDFKAINSVGYGFQVEMKYQAIKNGFKLVEIPITFKDRIKGKSKMHKGIIKEAFWAVLEMRKKRYGKSLAN